jgi:tellurite resistance protein
VIAAPSHDDRFNLEVVKLMLKVAWADGQVAPRERQVIMGAARSWHVAEPELKQLMARLDQGDPLPEPDVAVLKPRADDVMTAVRALVASDGKVAQEETALLEKIAAMLK